MKYKYLKILLVIAIFNIHLKEAYILKNLDTKSANLMNEKLFHYALNRYHQLQFIRWLRNNLNSRKSISLAQKLKILRKINSNNNFGKQLLQQGVSRNYTYFIGELYYK